MSEQAVEQALAFAQEHHRAGRSAAAEAIYRQILERHPAHVDALEALALLLLETGRLEDATSVFRRIVVAKPADLNALLTLGYLLHGQGLFDDEAETYRAALARFSDSHDLCDRLGNLERMRGNFTLAIDLARRAVQLRPGFWEARNNLGMALEQAGRSEEAARAFEEALRVAPGHAELHYNLAISLTSLSRLEDALSAYRRALDLNPAFAEAHNNLGAVCKTLGQLDESAAAFRAALRIWPQWAAAESNLAGVYEWQGRHDEALACHRRAMALAPDAAGIHGNYLYTLLFHPGYDAAALRREHAKWNRRHAAALAPPASMHANDPAPGRRLRIGYLCGLFRDHVLGRYLIPLLREHDRDSVDVVCYSTNRINDGMTARFQAVASAWRDIGAMSDSDVAKLIERDRVDILVDTTLHMEGNRLLVFARKPAPVQVTFAGYPGSTGLEAIDYRLSDPHLDPPGSGDAAYSERTWRLPDTFWCYDPLGADVEPGPLPAEGNGWVTFGCFNNFSKVNERVLDLWATTLRRVPDSRLVVLAHEGSHRRLAGEFMRERGIDPARVEFVGYRPRLAYLELFRRIDISLDTIPYSGHTTGLDSLWMGVPVVTLVGDTVVGRAGYSQSMNLNLPDLVASDAAEYVELAAALAGDCKRLRHLRATLRSRMLESPLMDARRFARAIETAYRAMWRTWCESVRR